MGFFDIVAGIGKAAVKSMGDTLTRQQLEAWEKVRRASPDRLRDFYDQNNTSQSNNASKRALALAGMGGWDAESLLQNDEGAKRALQRLRESVSLDDSHGARSLREAIDRILRS
ncbi:hypothetical protein [Pseudomonas putida]|uniref:hypothetical protein n=1 Tax=Pseudomonas putida TaxID=303 RepID=UPI0018D9ADA0|nr:hypothetical protein [Pseudomonas putida]MBH3411271.1 hypothetical protein [Pseudomonas putida]